MQRLIVIIAAGGSGTRFGSLLPKQFCTLGDRPVLSHACSRLMSLPGVVATVVVIDPAYAAYAPDGVLTAAPGRSRWASVRNALDACAHVEADVILVHDGARPLPSRSMMARVAAACRNHQGAIPVVAVTDSLRRADGSPANRADFRAVQTPQAFRADLLRQAYILSELPEFTDDASVMTAAGFGDIALVDGDTRNIKITNPMDLKIAGLYLEDGGVD